MMRLLCKLGLHRWQYKATTICTNGINWLWGDVCSACKKERFSHWRAQTPLDTISRLIRKFRGQE